MNGQPNVAWVLPDKMGGVLTIMANLLRHRAADGMPHHVVLTHNDLDVDTRFRGELAADAQSLVEYALPIENIHAVVRRLRDALPGGGGVLVANDLLELAMASAFDTGRTVVQILHGDYDYYYDLAVRHQDAIDVFVAYSALIANTLRHRLPARAADVYHVPYGVEIPVTPRVADAHEVLRLLFVGRLVEQKGVFHLPAIDGALTAAGIETTWTIVGAGPDGSRLRSMWPAPHVQWTGALAPPDVLALYPSHDVFVLPSRSEGFPVTLLEAMAAGVVPVISDLPSGVREVVEPRVTGWRPAVDDVAAFVAAIRSLADDRLMLERMSRAARDRVQCDFDIRSRVGGYERLFARHRELRRPRAAGVRMPYGSRLDHPWIPNMAVRAVRTMIRRARRPLPAGRQA